MDGIAKVYLRLLNPGFLSVSCESVGRSVYLEILEFIPGHAIVGYQKNLFVLLEIFEVLSVTIWNQFGSEERLFLDAS